MLHAQHLWVVFALALIPIGCTPAGCAGADPEQDKPKEDQFVGAIEQKLPEPVPDAPSFYGTWTSAKMAEHIDTLVLMTNGFYHASQNVVCVKAPCDPVTSDGLFKLYTREERRFIELKVADGQREGQRYEYAVSGTSLRLRPLVPGSEWFALDHSGTAWCSSERQCNYQNLPPAICAGSYKCELNVCAWKCVKNEDPSAAPPKENTTGAVSPGENKAP